MDAKDESIVSSEVTLPSEVAKRVSGEVLAPEDGEKLLPFLDEVLSMLRAGWHPQGLVRAIRRNHGVDLSEDLVTDLKEKLPPAEFHDPLVELVPHGVTVDPLRDLNRMVVYQQSYLAKLVRDADSTDAARTKITFEMNRLWKMETQLARLAQSLGVNLYADPQRRVGKPDEQGQMTVGDLIRQADKYSKVTARELTLERGE